jgi:hypothetical protein
VKRALAWGLGFVVAAVVIFAYYRTNYDPCFAIPFLRDSDNVLKTESRELLSAAKQMYETDTGRGTPDALTAPIKVTICGNKATLSVAGEIHYNDLGYASLWKDIYNAHHPSGLSWLKWCGKLRLNWKGGGLDQEFCGSPL